MRYELYEKILKKLFKHRTFQNVGYLTFGNVLAQVISLIGAFYIPKLLGPNNYGIYNTVTAYVGFFTIFTFSGLTQVIIREASKDTSKTKEILEATIGLRNIASIFATFVSILVVSFIDYEKATKLYIVVYSFYLLFKGTETSISTIFQSHQRMKILGVLSIVYQLLMVPLAIVFLYMGYGVLMLLILQLILQVFKSGVLYHYSQKIIVFNFFARVRFVREYLISGSNFTLLTFFNILSNRVDLVMLSFLTTPSNVGIYALASRFVNKGLVLRSPIAHSLFPYYSEKFEKKMPKVSMLLTHTALISIPLFFFLIPGLFVIEPLIKNVIGVEFLDSAAIFKVLVFYLIFNFSVIPWGLFLQATGNENNLLIVSIVTAITNIFLNIYFFELFGLIGIAYSTLVVQISNVILQAIIAINKINKS